MNWESQVIALLSAALVRPLVLAAAAWLVLRVFRVRHPASCHSVWTAVLIGMLLLPILSVISPHWRVPVLPSKHDAAVVLPVDFTPSALVDSEPLPDTRAAGTLPFEPVTLPTRARRPAVMELPFILRCYFAGLFAMIAYRIAGWVLLRRLLSRSKASRKPWLRESGEVITPVTVGVLRPCVLLPAAWRDWSADTRTAVFAHEFAHIRRNDALVSALARFVKCVLWFHPLTWWVGKKISDLAELACDAAALERTHDPSGYSRILLAFAEAVNRSGHRVALPGLAMAARSGMGWRIDQAFELSSGNMRKLARPGVVLVLMGMPVMCLAAAVGLGEQPAALPTFLLPVPRPPEPTPQVLAQAQAPVRAQTPVEGQKPPQTQAPAPVVIQTPQSTNPPSSDLPVAVPNSRANFYSREKEGALGKQLAAQIEHEIPLILDRPAAVEYVSRLGTKLAGQLPEPRFSYTFKITASDPSNVLHEPLALPGGYIFVPPSLFLAALDEAEFAGMLAHAMAHVSARHGTRQATGSELAKIAKAPLILKSGVWTTAGFRGSAEFLQFSEAYEREADKLAVAMISNAGYDPESMVRYFRRTWSNDSPDSQRAGVSSVTDSRDERIAGIESAVRKLTSPITYIPSDDFLRIKAQIPEPQ